MTNTSEVPSTVFSIVISFYQLFKAHEAPTLLIENDTEDEAQT